MSVYRITLERISTGERAPSLIVRAKDEAAAREHTETAIRQSPTPDDLVVIEIVARP